VNVSDQLIPVIFAYDTNIFIQGTDINSIIQKLNQELSQIVTWLNSNKLSLNVARTHYMIFRSKNRKIDTHDVLRINGTAIELVNSTKFIGVMLDSTLKWEPHIQHVKSKIAKGVGIICKARRVLEKKTLLTLYYSMVYPYITYCIEVWGNSAQVYISSVLKLQKKIIRIITSSNFRAESDPLFRSLKVLKVSQVYIKHIMVFMFKYNKGDLPGIFNTLFKRNSEVMSRVTRNAEKFYVPFCKTDIGKKSIRIQGPKLWNNLSDHIDSNCGIHTYKKKLQKYLLETSRTIV